ncbi:MAG: hypothetical protein AB1442_02240 [Nitrospirota bacterium]
MINFIGLFLVICGFLAPFLSAGRLPSIFFFWVGLLLLLWPDKHFAKRSAWVKWARIGLLLNVLGTLILILFSKLVLNTGLSHSYFAYVFLTIVNWIFNPITALFEVLFPYSKIEMAGGGIQFTTSFFRNILTSFFNVVVYIGSGIIFGKFVSRSKPDADG